MRLALLVARTGARKGGLGSLCGRARQGHLTRVASVGSGPAGGGATGQPTCFQLLQSLAKTSVVDSQVLAKSASGHRLRCFEKCATKGIHERSGLGRLTDELQVRGAVLDETQQLG